MRVCRNQLLTDATYFNQNSNFFCLTDLSRSWSDLHSGVRWTIQIQETTAWNVNNTFVPVRSIWALPSVFFLYFLIIYYFCCVSEFRLRTVWERNLQTGSGEENCLVANQSQYDTVGHLVPYRSVHCSNSLRHRYLHSGNIKAEIRIRQKM